MGVLCALARPRFWLQVVFKWQPLNRWAAHMSYSQAAGCNNLLTKQQTPWPQVGRTATCGTTQLQPCIPAVGTTAPCMRSHRHACAATARSVSITVALASACDLW